MFLPPGSAPLVTAQRPAGLVLSNEARSGSRRVRSACPRLRRGVASGVDRHGSRAVMLEATAPAGTTEQASIRSTGTRGHSWLRVRAWTWERNL